MILVIYLLISYLISSIPFGLLFCKIFANIDIREDGSKNIGATNAARLAGKKIGFATFFFDSFKSVIFLLIAKYYLFTDHQYLNYILLSIAIITIIGHIFSIYLKFKGGKAVATGFANLLIIHPIYALICYIMWAAIYLLFKISFLSALIAAVTIVIIALCNLFDIFLYQKIFIILLFTIITLRHKSNI